MKYIFEININTDGDFYLPFVPCGMKYDGCERYTFEKSYRDRNVAIENIVNICAFLKEEMDTRRDYVKESWDIHIDSFVKRLKTSSESVYERVEEYMSGNYEGTEFIFRVEAQKFNCSFNVTDEEFEMIHNNDNRVTIGMVKEAVLALFKQ